MQKLNESVFLLIFIVPAERQTVNKMQTKNCAVIFFLFHYSKLLTVSDVLSLFIWRLSSCHIEGSQGSSYIQVTKIKNSRPCPGLQTFCLGKDINHSKSFQRGLTFRERQRTLSPSHRFKYRMSKKRPNMHLCTHTPSNILSLLLRKHLSISSSLFDSHFQGGSLSSYTVPQNTLTRP